MRRGGAGSRAPDARRRTRPADLDARGITGGGRRGSHGDRAAVRGLGGRRDRGERGDHRWPDLTARAATRSMPCATGRSDRARRTSSTATRATASPMPRSRWRTTSGCCAAAPRRSSSTAASTRRSERGAGARACVRRSRRCARSASSPSRSRPSSSRTSTTTTSGISSAFPAATLIVPRRELEFWTGPMACALPVRLARGAARDRARRAGGRRRARAADRRERGDPRRRHRGRRSAAIRRASRSSSCEAVSGDVVLASDAVHFYEELELERPFAVMHDLEQMYVAYDS